ncbi:protein NONRESPONDING TO OXYLIPINS 2, mitochondrial isoform X2 [Quercus robur]|uniref:protein NONRESPONDING TO OXYLIPINS 2, mitochondrial isoform X2 n=1 Tax=Quercus robur TaxID=38942 RepID=UPI00216226D8|nr:protein NONRESPONDING TO OXYLIPINS 2, mitochondrial isoform X2 [Quercus robur]
MASLFCRSALKVGSTSRSSLASCSKTLNPKSLIPKSNIPSTPASAFSSSSTTIPRASRVVSVLGSVESMMPLHSAIASARLKSNIAIDSSCWSWLSQGTSISFPR